MTPMLMKICAGLTVWGLTLIGALSIANWSGDWGPSVCGAWGCGPPLQALVACHVWWLVALVPLPLIASRFVSTKSLTLAAASVLALASTAAVVIAIYQYFTWFTDASEWQRPFYIRRVGFVIFTTVELPLLELAALSLLILVWSSRYSTPVSTPDNHPLDNSSASNHSDGNTNGLQESDAIAGTVPVAR